MKRITSEGVYDTKRSTLVAYWNNTHLMSDPEYRKEELYITRAGDPAKAEGLAAAGTWFLRYWGVTDPELAIKPFDAQQAFEWVEQHGRLDEVMATLERVAKPREQVLAEWRDEFLIPDTVKLPGEGPK